MPVSNLYQALSLEHDASQEEIKRAYRTLAVVAHPDRGGDKETMSLLNEAYETLSDPQKRQEFDLKWEAFQDDIDQIAVVAGHLDAGDTPAYSYSFRQQHHALINQFERAPLRQMAARGHFQEFKSDLYSLESAFGAPKTVPDIFSFLEEKAARGVTESSPPPPDTPLTPVIAVKLFMDFLTGRYVGAGLAAIQHYGLSELAGNTLKHSQAPERLLYEGLFEIISMTQETLDVPHRLMPALKKITDFAKSASDASLQCVMPLFYNKHFRHLYAYALHEYWHATDSLFKEENLSLLDGRTQAKEFLEVLRERLSTSRDNQGLTQLIRRIKLLLNLEQDLHALRDFEATASDHRDRAFHLLDWIPAVLGTSKQIIVNLFLQIGMHFQQAARLEKRSAIKTADEKLALKMYLTATVGVGDHATPDVSLYATVQTLRYVAAFEYADPMLREVIPALQRRALVLGDVFPFFESPQSSIDFLRQENKSIQLMRRLLNTMVEVLEYNKSHSDGIALDHAASTVLYQVYEACLKNWFQERYDPETEQRFRLELMEELLFDNSWTTLDVDQNVDTPWVMVDRDEEGWLRPCRSLPYTENPEFVKYRAIKGAQINNTTGEIEFFMEPWHRKRPVYEQVFTLFDVAQMLERNLDSAIFSLDPVDADKPYHPFNAMRFAPPQLETSELFNTMLLTDYILKFLTTNQEVQGRYPYAQRPVAPMIEHLPAYLRKIIDDFHQAPHSGAIHRFWIEAETIDVTLSDEDNKEENITHIGLGRLRMVVKKHRMERDIHGELKDVGNEDEGWPIYVLTPRQWRELAGGRRTIEGCAMIFIYRQVKLFCWENHRVVHEHVPENYDETLIRLYQQPRDQNGRVKQDSNNQPLVYRVTQEMARQTGLPHRYSAEFIFAHQFTLHYDEFSQYLPEFGRLKELSKISVLLRVLNSVRQSNEEQIEALNFILNAPLRRPPDTEVYRNYHSRYQRICERVKSVFENLSQEVSSAALGRKWGGELRRIQNQIGTLRFTRNSREVNDACDELHRQASRANPGVPSWRISREVVEPERSKIAEQLSQMKQRSCREQLTTIFSSRLSSSNREHCIDSFIQGNLAPLTEALVSNEKKQAQQQLRPQFSNSSTRDIALALEGDRAAVGRVAKLESQAQLKVQRTSKKKIESGFVEIGLGRDVKASDVKGQCFWVPASVRHEVREDAETLSRHSFFVYGGVRVQPRINVIRASAPPRSAAVRAAGGGGIRSGDGGNFGGGGGSRYRPPPSKIGAQAITSSRNHGLSHRGVRPQAGTRVWLKDLPRHWRVGPSRSVGGVKYVNPQNKHHNVRVEQGVPNHRSANSRGPHVADTRDGSKVDMRGNRVGRSDSAGHIPLNQYQYIPPTTGPKNTRR